LGKQTIDFFWPDYYDHEIKEFDKYLMFLSKVRLRYGFLTDKILFIVYFLSIFVSILNTFIFGNNLYIYLFTIFICGIVFSRLNWEAGISAGWEAKKRLSDREIFLKNIEIDKLNQQMDNLKTKKHKT
jgi:hypothetical protein